MLDRRTVIAGALATAVPLASGRAAGLPSHVDVAIVGAGAAGIGAARRVLAAGRTCVVLEASDRVGGRCRADTTTFGVPVDLGAHWLHAAALTPFPALARDLGVALARADHDETLWIGRRRAGDEELDAFSGGIEAFVQAIGEAGRQGIDVAAAEMMPRGLGAVADLVAFAVGPNDCGKDLDHVSTLDFARSREGTDHLLAGGYGPFLARLASGLPIVGGVAVTRIDRTSRRVGLDTTAGRLEADAVIVTASTDALARGAVRFDPPLPPDQEDALSGVSLGVYERVILEIPGNPFRFRPDEDVFFVRPGKRTLRLTANVGGSSLVFADAGGSFAEDLVKAGEAAMVDFAASLLVETFGSEARKAIGRSRATAWRRDPWIAGSFSCAEPGHGNDRTILRRPVDERVRLAGEATHPTLWGTVGGAFLEGERAASESLAALPR